jgi:ABC-type cobalamin/Fe3+-siderophores transport system ATPase subunit
MEDRITIIHGRNGFGKTTLLKLINAIFNSRYMLLLNSGNRIIIRIKF